LKVEFDVKEYVKNIPKSGTYFHTFINKDSLAAGVLRLVPGEDDIQTPHDNDEIYYVIDGDGFLNISGKDYPIREGRAYFVGKKVKHKFHGNKRELVVLYFFGGPDS
jgi:mannose-6-phosphate isomerase-like protein (cupin superfamily)